MNVRAIDDTQSIQTVKIQWKTERKKGTYVDRDVCAISCHDHQNMK